MGALGGEVRGIGERRAWEVVVRLLANRADHHDHHRDEVRVEGRASWRSS